MTRTSTLGWIGWGLYCVLSLLAVALFFAGALLSFVRLVEPEGSFPAAAGFSALALAPALVVAVLAWGLGRALQRR